MSFVGTSLGAITGSYLLKLAEPSLNAVIPFPLKVEIFIQPILISPYNWYSYKLNFFLNSLTFMMIKIIDLYRSHSINSRFELPNLRQLLHVFGLIFTLIIIILLISPDITLALWFIFGSIFSFIILNLMSLFLKHSTKKLITTNKINKMLSLKLALHQLVVKMVKINPSYYL